MCYITMKNYFIYWIPYEVLGSCLIDFYILNVSQSLNWVDTQFMILFLLKSISPKIFLIKKKFYCQFSNLRNITNEKFHLKNILYFNFDLAWRKEKCLNSFLLFCRFPTKMLYLKIFCTKLKKNEADQAD